MKEATLALIVRNGSVLLGEKKKGAEIGSGTLNGPGGKIHKGETPEECVIRETWEEVGIDLLPSSLERVAVITFFAGDVPDFLVHIYRIEIADADPKETAEMYLPQWYPLDDLPLDRMLDSDKEWFARATRGDKFTAEVRYRERAKDFERIVFGPLR